MKVLLKNRFVGLINSARDPLEKHKIHRNTLLKKTKTQTQCFSALSKRVLYDFLSPSILLILNQSFLSVLPLVLSPPLFSPNLLLGHISGHPLPISPPTPLHCLSYLNITNKSSILTPLFQNGGLGPHFSHRKSVM